MAANKQLQLKTSVCKTSDDKPLDHVPRSNKLFTTVFIILAVSTAFAITLFLFLSYYDVSIKISIVPKQQFITSSERYLFTDNTNQDQLENVTIISRDVWQAQTPTHPLDPLPLPVPFIIIHFTATKNCSTPPQCMHYARIIQTLHMRNRQWWDIGYNFLIGGDGRVYEGRGWKNMGAHTKGYNSKSIGITFIGTFNDEKPPKKQLDACKTLIAQGVQMGYVVADYKLFGARQFQPPLSPGDALYEEIKMWKHWSKSVQ